MSLRVRHNPDDEFERALPAEGVHHAVCCDVYDKGIVHNRRWDADQHKCLIGWQLEESHPDFNEPFLIWREYTVSLHSNSNLARDLETWRGAPIDDLADEDGVIDFDLEALIGVRATLHVKHSDDGEWANIVGVYSPKKTNNLEVSSKYIRKEEREAMKEQDRQVEADLSSATGDPEDDLPF